MRLDDFYDQARLDFLKIDVEGMEAAVLLCLHESRVKQPDPPSLSFLA